jgi:hydrogenase maturation protease
LEGILKKTLVLGLGNELRGDDAVGMRVVRKLRRSLPGREDVAFQEASVAGLAILDLVCGYQNLIVVDAIETEGGEPGQIYRLSEESLPGKAPRWSLHGLGLSTVLELGRRCGCHVPENIVIYAIEVENTEIWRRGCTHRVQRAIPLAVQLILREEMATDFDVSAN